MSRDDFLRRYATSPIHVPRLERLLQAYGDDEQNESFSRRFIGWDRACRDAEAARIVAEVLSVSHDGSGRIVRVPDDTLQGAIRWMAEATWHPVADRARILGDAVSSRDHAAHAMFVEFLEASAVLDDDPFRPAEEAL